MSTFITIIAGVSVFVLGQILLKLLIDPIHELKRSIAEIAHTLIEHANIYANPGTYETEKEMEISSQFRRLSSQLNAGMYLIPYYKAISRIFGLPSVENINKASKKLIGLSNGFNDRPNRGILNTYLAQHTRDALGIFVPEGERLDPEHEREFLNG